MFFEARIDKGIPASEYAPRPALAIEAPNQHGSANSNSLSNLFDVCGQCTEYECPADEKPIVLCP